MLRTCKKVNVYAENQRPLNDYSAPPVEKAKAVFRNNMVAPNLDKECIPAVTADTLRTDFDEAQQIFKEQIWNGYTLLNCKGYLTPDEWQLLVTSAGKNTFLFPDVSLSLGTKKSLVTAQGEEENFVRSVLREKGAEPIIREAAGGELLGINENGERIPENEYLAPLVSALGIRTAFEQMELKLEQTNYKHTKKCLHYLTLYDLILHQFGSERVFTPQELIQKIDASEIHDTAGMIALKTAISEMNAASFWQDYEKFREFQLLKVMLHWYSASTVRSLSGKAYEYISEQISEDTLKKGLAFFRIHTAFMDTARANVTQQGSTAVFTYTVEHAGGEIRAAISTKAYPETLGDAEFVFTPPNAGSLKLNDLKIGTTYFVSLFEYMSDTDCVKLGNLPQVTPGVSWPNVTAFTKSLIGNSLDISMQASGGDGKLRFKAVLCEDSVKITDPNTGTELSGTTDGGKISFHADDLAYDETVTVAVFILLNDGEYFNKIQEFSVTPKETQMVQAVRRSADYKKKMIEFDFAEKAWPAEFGDNTLAIACHTQHYPKNPGDTEPFFTKKTLSKSDYHHGAFRVGLKKENTFPVIYISGWLSGIGGTQPVIRNAIFNLKYRVKKPFLPFLGKNITVTVPKPAQFSEKWKLPKLTVTVYNKNNAVIFNQSGLEFDPQSGSYTCKLNERAAYILIEATDPTARQQYQFINKKNDSMGKTAI